MMGVGTVQNRSTDKKDGNPAEYKNTTRGMSQRADNMRRVREQRRLAGDRRKEKQFQPVESDLEITRVSRRTQTRRGEKYLRASEVENRLVQDRSQKQVLVGSDVEALYPSLLDIQVAEIIFTAVLETDVGFEGVNYQEGCRYIVLNCYKTVCGIKDEEFLIELFGRA